MIKTSQSDLWLDIIKTSAIAIIGFIIIKFIIEATVFATLIFALCLINVLIFIWIIELLNKRSL